MEIDLIAESLKFMFLGMGIVFTFLIILIFILKAQGALLSKYFPAENKVVSNINLKDSSKNNETAKIAAIVAAVQHHKNLKG